MRFFDEAKELLDLLSRASDSYYNEAVSLITDAEYDQKKDRLIVLYEKILLPKKSIDVTLVKEVEEFLNQIGAPVSVSEWKKAKHEKPMTSLNKVNSEDEFRKWAAGIGDKYYVMFDKMDGGSIDLRYENGDLVQAITRGGGDEGEDMLPNVIKMQNVKKHIPSFTGNLYGEVFISRDDFETLNAKSTHEYKNPRNTAIGLQKTLTGENVELLSIIFYDIRGVNVTTEEGKLHAIEAFGLKTCFWKKVTLKEAIEIYYEYHQKIRATLPYDIDGLVVRANSLDLQAKHGMLGGNPKAQIAWKFPPLQVVSKIIDIKWNVGNSRRITPIIHIEPTPVGGITVRKMSGFNLDFFKKLHPYEGAKLLFQRSNDVIPVPLKIVE